MKSVKIEILPDPEGVSQAACDIFIEKGVESIEKNGRFTVVLSGGTTPRSLYQLLTTDQYRERIDWESVVFFLGDERDVSPASGQSNFKMANETLLKPLGISRKNIFRWRTEIIEAAETAGQYEQKIRKFFELQPGEFPEFDLILLGMGDDGHTASLFPHTKALAETTKIAVANLVQKLDTIRLTLTVPAINHAANVIFMVCGESKARTLHRVLKGKSEPEKLPAQMIRPKGGKTLWLVDEAAASQLKK